MKFTLLTCVSVVTSLFLMPMQELGDGEAGIEWEEYEVSGDQSLPNHSHSQPVNAKHSPSDVHRSSYK